MEIPKAERKRAAAITAAAITTTASPSPSRAAMQSSNHCKEYL
ncbi:MAG: hypothetical protein Q4A83_04520 [Bacillota bacterium]|nr:hypothetical protein [Bacillota bacterium]